MLFRFPRRPDSRGPVTWPIHGSTVWHRVILVLDLRQLETCGCSDQWPPKQYIRNVILGLLRSFCPFVMNFSQPQYKVILVSNARISDLKKVDSSVRVLVKQVCQCATLICRSTKAGSEKRPKGRDSKENEVVNVMWLKSCEWFRLPPGRRENWFWRQLYNLQVRTTKKYAVQTKMFKSAHETTRILVVLELDM